MMFSLVVMVAKLATAVVIMAVVLIMMQRGSLTLLELRLSNPLLLLMKPTLESLLRWQQTTTLACP